MTVSTAPLLLPLPELAKPILSILSIDVQTAPPPRCYHSLIMFDPRFNKRGCQWTHQLIDQSGFGV